MTDLDTLTAELNANIDRVHEQFERMREQRDAAREAIRAHNARIPKCVQCCAAGSRWTMCDDCPRRYMIEGDW